jgi:hypothetical protein
VWHIKSIAIPGCKIGATMATQHLAANKRSRSPVVEPTNMTALPQQQTMGPAASTSWSPSSLVAAAAAAAASMLPQAQQKKQPEKSLATPQKQNAIPMGAFTTPPKHSGPTTRNKPKTKDSITKDSITQENEAKATRKLWTATWINSMLFICPYGIDLH